VGLANAKLLCSYFDYDIGKITETAASEHYMDELGEIKGFGDVIAHNLHVYFSDEKNISLFEKALKYLRFIKTETADPNKRPLQGLKFVITGETVMFDNRKALQAFIEKNGGGVTGTVTSKTSFLINNDNSSGASKNKKAAELGVGVLSEEAFMGKFGLSIG
jgi:DNA ligase (NAD+)